MTRRDRRPTPEAGPDLIPFMNLTTMLIPLLLMGATFAHLSVVESTLPAIGPITPCATSCGEAPLNLRVAITADGFKVTGADAVLVPEESEEDGRTIAGHDYAELTRALALVKDEYPDEQNLILTPHDRASYELIIGAMDAAREDEDRELFPYVVIAGG